MKTYFPGTYAMFRARLAYVNILEKNGTVSFFLLAFQTGKLGINFSQLDAPRVFRFLHKTTMKLEEQVTHVACSHWHYQLLLDFISKNVSPWRWSSTIFSANVFKEHIQDFFLTYVVQDLLYFNITTVLIWLPLHILLLSFFRLWWSSSPIVTRGHAWISRPHITCKG